MQILANLIGWRGFRSWQFWAGLMASIMLFWLILTNITLNNKVAEQGRQITVAESQLDQALKLNEQLNKDIVKLQLGKVIDEEIVRDNQLQIDKLRKEHNERVQEVNRQKPSGPAPAAVICAITRVCD